MISNIHKLFGAMLHLSEHVMRWIGGQAHQLGELHDEARVRANFMAGTNVLNRAQGNAPGKGRSGQQSGGWDGEQRVER
jgi:molybdopterin-biosynthesis enzyme MoeA-like protein